MVLAALAGNVAIAVCKFVAAYFSHSAAMLAEAVHSLSDTGNQVLLLIGMRLALRAPDDRHPFGRAMEHYFWPFVVSFLLFALGGAFGLYEGVHKLHTPGPTPTGRELLWAYAVLGTSVVFESLSFSVAFREFKKMLNGRPIQKVLLETRDITVPLVLFEDTAALMGLTVALLGIGVSQVFHVQAADAIASMVIGVGLTGVAVFLAWQAHGLLIGVGATREDRDRARGIIEGTPGVTRVVEMLTMHFGPEDIMVALKVAFDQTMTVPALEETINEIERRVRKDMPQMKRIFIEPDSQGVHEAPAPDGGA